MPKLSDNQIGDRHYAALEAIGTDEGETIRGNTALVAARQTLSLLEQGLLIAAERNSDDVAVRISWFGEEVLNARVEIGDDGVEIGQVEHKACEDLRSGWALTPERFTAHNLKVMSSNPIRNQTSSPTPIRLHG